MAAGKTGALTCRIEPAPKKALRTAAEHEHRSITKMVEVLTRDYCGRNGITIQERQALLLDNAPEPRPRKR